MSKKSPNKQKISRPNISPLTMLRPRLDGLFGNEDFGSRDNNWIKGDLDAVFKGLEPANFLPVLLKAYHTATPLIQTRLNNAIPEWLTDHAYTDTLLQMIEQQKIDSTDQKQAAVWLESIGMDVSQLQKQVQNEASFHKAYTYQDDSQGILVISCYPDARMYKVQIMSFLFDFNPPWEGSIKDFFYRAPSPPNVVLKDLLDYWKRRRESLTEITAEEAKLKLLNHLAANLHEGIRLHRDLITARNIFLKYLSTLPDTPKTPSFTEDDFVKLCHLKKTTESIMKFEKNVGRRVRVDDGKEILVMGNPFEKDEADWF